MNKQTASKILDEVREKIANIINKNLEHDWDMSFAGLGRECMLKSADQILSLSGTTDIECPECVKGMVMPVVTDPSHLSCGKCHGENVIKHKWKIVVE